jgi:hypothetical protein
MHCESSIAVPKTWAPRSVKKVKTERFHGKVCAMPSIYSQIDS